MKQWLRKFIAILLTVMTLGIYIPPSLLTSDLDQDKESLASKSNINETPLKVVSETTDQSDHDVTDSQLSKKQTQAVFTQVMTEKAREQTIYKFGDRIAEQVEDEFMTTILPHMEMVIEMILTDTGEEPIYFGITEEPTSGYGERIFNIFDYRTHKDIARFDVRRENRPLEGYWFNFHYHLNDDNFEQHYNLGDIFWDKNTPPKWMT